MIKQLPYCFETQLALQFDLLYYNFVLCRSLVLAYTNVLVVLTSGTRKLRTPYICFYQLPSFSNHNILLQILLFSNNHSTCNLFPLRHPLWVKDRGKPRHASRYDRFDARDSGEQGSESRHGTPTRRGHPASTAPWHKPTIQ